jgi:hypothetical protein
VPLVIDKRAGLSGRTISYSSVLLKDRIVSGQPVDAHAAESGISMTLLFLERKTGPGVFVYEHARAAMSGVSGI